MKRIVPVILFLAGIGVGWILHTPKAERTAKADQSIDFTTSPTVIRANVPGSPDNRRFDPYMVRIDNRNILQRPVPADPQSTWIISLCDGRIIIGATAASVGP